MVRRNRHVILRVAALMLGASLGLLTTVDFPGIPDTPTTEETKGFLRFVRVRETDGEDGHKAVPIAIAKDVVADSASAAKKSEVPHPPQKPPPHSPNSGVVVRVAGVVNPHPFKYTITPGFCAPGKDGPLVVAYVHSAPQKSQKRATIRNTWANKLFHGKYSMEVFFATGLVSNPGIQKALEEESALHKDILQENYIDDYKNLTYKGVGSLRWISDNCRNTKFILKTDDDAFVNVFSLLKHLDDLSRTGQTSNIFLCRLMPNMPVLRQGKWGIPLEMYPHDRYPPYCSGLAFVLSMDVAKALYKASYHTPLFWVDDAWLTGMVAATAKVNHTQASRAYDLNKDNIEKKFLGVEWYQYLFGHLGPKNFKLFWEELVVIARNRTIPNSDMIVPGKVFVKKPK